MDFDTLYKNETYLVRFLNKKEKYTLYDIGVGPKSEYISLSKELNLKIFGTEPDPRQFEIIKKKFIELNGTLFDFAISDEPLDNISEKKIYLQKDNLLNAGFKRPKIGSAINVKLKTLDNFDALCNQAKNIILWMDIEGYELKALKSGKSLLSSRRVKIINLEVRRDKIDDWPTKEEIEFFLRKYNYRKLSEYNFHSTHNDVLYILND
jgi:FkbM family methyltransferase